MARIDALPSVEIIRGLKGILDFYMWRGLPCVRAWPRWRPARQTNPSKAAALLFGAIVKAYSLLGHLPLDAYRDDALDQPRTPRDIMVTGVYGNLHEASMSDFLTLLTQCRDFLSNLTDLLHALDSIDTDELVVNVDQSVLPPLAATTTNQATIIAALQKIDDLQDALESKALDRLLVRGQDQLFSYKGTYQELVTFTATAAAHNYFVSSTVPPGQIRLITGMACYNRDGPFAIYAFYVNDVSFRYNLRVATGFPIGQTADWNGLHILVPTQEMNIDMQGVVVGNRLYFSLWGHTMTLET